MSPDPSTPQRTQSRTPSRAQSRARRRPLRAVLALVLALTAALTLDATAGVSLAGSASAATSSVTAVTPLAGATTGGTTVTVTGTGLTDAMVMIGPQIMTLTESDDTHLVFVTPASAAGMQPLQVLTTGGTFPFTYTYVDPTVTGASPASGTTAGGTAVTVTGTYLEGVTSATIGGVAASLVSVASDHVVLTAPAGSGANLSLVLSRGASLVGATTWSYDAPVITSVSPDHSASSGGGTVTITGTDLGPSPSVTIGGTSAAIVSASRTEIKATVPVGEPGSAPVVVTVGGQASNAAAFSYDAPTVTSVSPSAGITAGDTLTITGTSFGTSPTVRIGGASATRVSASHTQIVVTAPGHVSGASSLVVTSNGQSSAAFPVTYGGPVVTAMNPATSSTAGGGTVTLTGTGLAGASVTVGGGSALVSSSSETSLTFTVPASASGGTADVTVTNDGLTYDAGDLTYDAPEVTALSEASGRAGDTLTLTGTSLGTAPTVTFDGVAASVVSATHGQVVVTVPAHAAGAVDVVVTHDSGSSDPVTFTYLGDPPTLRKLSAGLGPLSGRTVAITGTHLEDATSVTIGGVAAAFTVKSDTRIVLTVPAGKAGLVDVVVTSPTGTSNALPFRYLPRPKVTSLSRAHGRAGQRVRVRGTALKYATAVTVGGKAVVFDGSITGRVSFVLPKHAPGWVAVRVTTPGGTSRVTTVSRLRYLAG
ncbi:IPT/TIG domain-containing protein [Nocardioides sp. GY 10127]|uniref:IPT/TIG domain-containing protein n=1 Tax=Nocardioides sp. GY 10127 TaxID=2569762 RepID=UPI0010A888F2|nr:IPT/TIG domain-containing protein [Nocardioides sp. GY 10127]TIC79437.1 hypothetical protein E8D37_17855 [Nocardioides sp. GY 10127]